MCVLWYHYWLFNGPIWVDAEREVVADVVVVEMPVDAGIQDVEAVPSDGEDGVELKVAAVRFLVGLQLAFGITVGELGFMLIQGRAFWKVAGLVFISMQVGTVFVIVVVD